MQFVKVKSDGLKFVNPAVCLLLTCRNLLKGTASMHFDCERMFLMRIIWSEFHFLVKSAAKSQLIPSARSFSFNLNMSQMVITLFTPSLGTKWKIMLALSTSSRQNLASWTVFIFEQMFSADLSKGEKISKRSLVQAGYCFDHNGIHWQVFHPWKLTVYSKVNIWPVIENQCQWSINFNHVLNIINTVYIVFFTGFWCLFTYWTRFLRWYWLCES